MNTIQKAIAQTEEFDLPLPTIKPPKKRKSNSRVVNIEDNNELADEIYTCQVCNIRGHCNDEEVGILWVGCDGCDRWFHRDCLNYQEQTDVDLSLIVSSNWLCHHCSPSDIIIDAVPSSALGKDHVQPCHGELDVDVEPFSTLHQDSEIPEGQGMLICQVCMVHQFVSPIEEEVYWASCYYCNKSYHASCLPSRIYRAYEMRKLSDSSWCCQMCPAR
ncbi:uncharacterized protein LOC117316975 [Pecten maximus]|uniref:uncharacterized protein LOC117316975 n=1 Tax=Pecten maximus TaxID=6579 RepID=UPI001459081D|nr:uncharacterized protein LOC117316975 [Pecten maximus]